MAHESPKSRRGGRLCALLSSALVSCALLLSGLAATAHAADSSVALPKGYYPFATFGDDLVYANGASIEWRNLDSGASGTYFASLPGWWNMTWYPYRSGIVREHGLYSPPDDLFLVGRVERSGVETELLRLNRSEVVCNYRAIDSVDRNGSVFVFDFVPVNAGGVSNGECRADPAKSSILEIRRDGSRVRHRIPRALKSLPRLHPATRSLIAQVSRSRVEFWSLDTRRRLRTFRSHGPRSSISVDTGTTTAILVRRNDRVRRGAARSGRRTRSYSTFHISPTSRGVRASGDLCGNVLVARKDEPMSLTASKVKLFDPRTGRSVSIRPDRPHDLSFATCGDRLAFIAQTQSDVDDLLDRWRLIDLRKWREIAVRER